MSVFEPVDGDFLKDEVVVVIGNAPSVNDVDLSLLDGVKTIGVNQILSKYQPSAVCAVDEPVVRMQRKALQDYSGKLYTWDKINPDVWPRTVEAFSLAGNMGNPSTWRWPSSLEHSLVRQGTTPAYALQLALLSGAKAIGVLGVDYNAPSLLKKGKPSHFYGYAGKGYVCEACGSYFSEKKLKIDRGDQVCPRCHVINRVHPIHVTGGGAWTKREYAFYNRFRITCDNEGVPCYNLSPCRTSALAKAGWERARIEEFVAKYNQPSG